jgi:hypothetical protein
MSVEKIPAWLTITQESATIKLSKPSTANGIEVDTVVMRSPSLREVRAIDAIYPKDQNAHELALFASLTDIGEKDLQEFRLKDHMRLQRGYFRLVTDDEV